MNDWKVSWRWAGSLVDAENGEGRSAALRIWLIVWFVAAVLVGVMGVVCLPALGLANVTDDGGLGEWSEDVGVGGEMVETGDVVAVGGGAGMEVAVPVYSSTVTSSKTSGRPDDGRRASSSVVRADLERRQPRSTPEALRYEAGVYVQQTSSAQGSPYVRGLTGQQTLLVFDGIRLNNSLFRYGPNQYLFTVDPATVDSIDVTRGSASVLWGSDALGGVVAINPVKPRFSSARARAVGVANEEGEEGEEGDGGEEGKDGQGGGAVLLDPGLRLRYGSADGEVGGRVSLNGAIPGKGVAFVGGIGARRAGELESGGPVIGQDGKPALVPRLREDGRTQMGTGFSELTGDGRLLFRLGERNLLTAAAYLYRQYDAPRTDHCPSAYAPDGECLTIDEQFRTMSYVRLEGWSDWLRSYSATASWQRQHELRTMERSYSAVRNGGQDDVDTYGLIFKGETRQFRPLGGADGVGRALGISLEAGADFYHDRVASSAWTGFSDTGLTRQSSRGQYMDGSTWTMLGVFGGVVAEHGDWLGVRFGGRYSAAGANADADPESMTAAIDKWWQASVFGGGIRISPWPWLSLLVNVDEGFRAPNLDDLTSRQQTGPGYQFENGSLAPERSLTQEAGIQLDADWFGADLWVFRSTIAHAIARQSVPAAQCPASGGDGCSSSWWRYRLVNTDGDSEVYGLEVMSRISLSRALKLRATLAWTYGEGPNPGAQSITDPDASKERVPLSRIPPTNGTVELSWLPMMGRVELGAGLRWATAQSRLAVHDYTDPRIPFGGTPGYGVLDMSARYRFAQWGRVAVVLENVGDQAYRYHGSSVNGAGRSVMMTLDLGYR